MEIIPAYVCELASGRVVVVTSEAEAEQSFYQSRHRVQSVSHARYEVYRKNYRKYGPTAFLPNDRPPQFLWEEVNSR